MADAIIPRHIVFVPDGNRRYAKHLGKHSSEGHRAGADVFRSLLNWCKELGVKEVSFWGASTENLKRDRLEVEFLFRLFGEMCDEMKKKCSGKNKENLRVLFCGARSLLPKSLQKKMAEVEELTKNNTDYRLNLLIAYGGREEISQAVRRIAKDAIDKKIKPEDITDDVFKSYLYLQSEPDLIIRTGHACLSGLLPWQSAYAEIIFLEDIFWPEFTKEKLKECLETFAKRKRSFGK